MNKLKILAVLASIGILSGCFQNSAFTGTSSNGSASGLDGAFANSGLSPDDPLSPVFFQNTIGNQVLFAVDQSSLSPQARTILDAQASWLISNPDYSALIEGHADQQGTREYNLALGARRAHAVREFLVSRGVSNNRLETISFGKERPVEFCAQESCYQKNRRAVSVLRASGNAL